MTPGRTSKTTCDMNLSFPNATESFRRKNPHIFNHETRIIGKLQCSEPQPYQKATLDSADGREIQGLPRTLVRFVGYRCRPLDPDNFAGGCKDLLDGLRHANLISGDEPWKITFATSQVKVAHRSQERTEIEISDE